ncbi:MAG: antitoxin [Deltaproteobacteria bacterium]|nr:antitoxin [Deltaproteobacteria bacterium]
MNFAKSYITDEAGKIKSVILDYKLYQKIEEIFLDQGLLKAMREVEQKEEVSYEQVRELIKEL